MATKTVQSFRVALNPRNPEANSWYDPKTRVNLFLNSPQSEDISSFTNEELQAVGRGIKAGLLIVSQGSIPEGLVNISDINTFAAPRARWGEDALSGMESALKNHDAAIKE